MSFSRIGIVGAGIMGEAVIVSLLRAGFPADAIVIVEKREERREEIERNHGVSSGSISDCDAIFLLVKPQDLEATLSSLKPDIKEDALVVSFIAGKKIASIQGVLNPSQRIVRIMPNTPMTLGKGFCALSLGPKATTEDQRWLEKSLSTSSRVITVSEDLQDAITALSGSGPAYLFAMVEAMSEAGIRLGLSETDSLEAAKQVLIGAAAMVELSGKDPKTLRENVTSPNGTTFAALTKMKEEGFAELIYQAMKSARDRSIELGQ